MIILFIFNFVSILNAILKLDEGLKILYLPFQVKHIFTWILDILISVIVLKISISKSYSNFSSDSSALFFFFLIFILSFIKFPLSMFIYNPRFTPTPCNIFLAFVPISFYPSLNNLFMRVHWFSRLSHWRGKNRSKKKQTNYAIFAFMWNEIYIQRLFKKKRRNVFFIWWKILFGKEFLYNS